MIFAQRRFILDWLSLVDLQHSSASYPLSRARLAPFHTDAERYCTTATTLSGYGFDAATAACAAAVHVGRRRPCCRAAAAYPMHVRAIELP